MTNESKTLYYLEDLPDFKVADDYYDIRGWVVKDATNRTIGKVDGLLVNKESKRTVYIDVEVDEALITQSRTNNISADGSGAYEFLSKDGDDHLIIPVEMVLLDEGRKEVQASRINFETFTKAKRFRKAEGIDPIYETEILQFYMEQKTYLR